MRGDAEGVARDGAGDGFGGGGVSPEKVRYRVVSRHLLRRRARAAERREQRRYVTDRLGPTALDGELVEAKRDAGRLIETVPAKRGPWRWLVVRFDG